MLRTAPKAILIVMLVAIAHVCIAQTDEVKKILIDARQKSYPENAVMVLRADSLAKATKDVAGQAAANNAAGGIYYSRDADKAIMHLQKARDQYTSLNNKKMAAYCMQNIAFAYEEQKNNVPTALDYTRKALQLRAELKDTMEQANMYKYQAYLLGILQNFTAAKKSAWQAIALYKAKNFGMGVAVSYRDLATVYEEERKTDSCIYYYLKAKATWKEANGEISRIYGWNNDLLRIYTAGNKLPEAGEIFAENEAIDATGFYYTDKLNFYKVSNMYFAKSHDDKMATKYMVKANNMIDSLRQKGIKPE